MVLTKALLYNGSLGLNAVTAGLWLVAFSSDWYEITTSDGAGEEHAQGVSFMGKTKCIIFSDTV